MKKRTKEEVDYELDQVLQVVHRLNKYIKANPEGEFVVEIRSLRTNLMAGMSRLNEPG